MRMLFKIWFFVTVASLVIYVPTYFISNDAIDAVQEATAEDLIPITGMQGRDNERFAAFLHSEGIDTSTTFVDALEENDLFSDVEVDYVDDARVKQIDSSGLLERSGLKFVAITAKLEGGMKFAFTLGVYPKHFLRDWTFIKNVMGMEISKDDTVVSLLNSPENETIIWVLLSSKKADQRQVVEAITNPLLVSLSSKKISSEKAQNEAISSMNEMVQEGNVNQSTAEAASEAAAQTYTALPFVGKRYFNFAGGSGTGQFVTIQRDGQTKIEGCSSTDALFDDIEPSCTEFYNGPFSKAIKVFDSIYRIEQDRIYDMEEDGSPAKECEAMSEDCSVELASVDE